MVNLGFFNEERYDMNCPKFNFNEVHHDSHVRDHRSILEVTQGIGTHLCVVCARSGFPSARINDFARYEFEIKKTPKSGIFWWRVRGWRWPAVLTS